MKKLLASVLTTCLVLSASVVLATPVEVGNHVEFISGGGPSGGGVFNFVVLEQNAPFQSFCLERDEYISIGGIYTVVGISNLAMMGGINTDLGDPLSGKTAWLFYSFAMGTLPGYDGSLIQQGLLQNAIWMLEGELAIPNEVTNPYYILAMTSPNAWANDDIGPVRVLNLISPKGAAQDQLIVTPEPLSLLLLGLGLVGVAGIRRKIK